MSRHMEYAYVLCRAERAAMTDITISHATPGDIDVVEALLGREHLPLDGCVAPKWGNLSLAPVLASSVSPRSSCTREARFCARSPWMPSIAAPASAVNSHALQLTQPGDTGRAVYL